MVEIIQAIQSHLNQDRLVDKVKKMFITANGMW